MSISLRTKVTAFTAAIVVTASLMSAALTISAQKKSIEREVVARGSALAEALARSVDEGLAAENLNLIKNVEDVVHTNDVVLAQVFSSLWLGVASVPQEKLNTLPDPVAVEHYRISQKNEHDIFSIDTGPFIDVYSPVLLESHDARIPPLFIGYVRLWVSTAEVRKAVTRSIIVNALATALLTLFAVIALNVLIGKYVLRPVLNLHNSVARHKKGEFPATVPVTTDDEIGELSAEFNEMSRTLQEREEKLAEEKELLSVTLRSIGDAVIVTDVDGTITLLNKVAEQLTGWTSEEAGGRPLGEVFHIINEKTRQRCDHPVQKVIATGLICGLANHTALIRKDGAEKIIEDSAAPIRDRMSRIVGVVLVFRDTTDKKRMEEELLKAEKLQSVGVLAGGLAHDFNNLLTAILGNISMARMYIDSRSKASHRLTDAEAASRRATELTHQLLTFAKGGAPVRQAVSIGDIVREAANFALHGTPVLSEFSLPEGLWTVEVDAGQMSQVFHNLIINAVQAMPKGGTVFFTAENVALADNDVPTLDAGNYVRIVVRDTGPGIPEEHRPRIFEPYFTTKQQGSGLGLASVYSIVKKHDGHITVSSDLSSGTTFEIYLPALRNEAASLPVEPDLVTRGRGKILIMDDEKIVRELSGEMLRALGYDVEFAGNGAEALERYRRALEEKSPFHAVIMDLTIPGGMGGKETIQKLRELDPEVRAIVSSGYSNDPIMAEYRKYGFRGVIVKPYNIVHFSRTISDVLAG